MALVALTTTTPDVVIDRMAILQTLKLNPNDPKTQALLLVCDRYGLDPVLKHMVLVDGNPYVTRDGLLHVAHTSKQFDGIEVLSEDEDTTHWKAKVAVYRKDMTRPIAYTGRYPKSGSNKKYGPEMAVKTAEVAALRRAFSVTGIATLEEQWDKADAVETVSVAAAKKELLAALDDDKDAAKEMWSEHFADAKVVTRAALDDLLNHMPAPVNEDDDVTDAELLDDGRPFDPETGEIA